jgi:hypothetical protein
LFTGIYGEKNFFQTNSETITRAILLRKIRKIFKQFKTTTTGTGLVSIHNSIVTDPGTGINKISRSGINIPDPQHNTTGHRKEAASSQHTMQ